MTQKDIMWVKKDGKLLAMRTGDYGCEYWLKGDTIYSLNSDGVNGCVWCGLQRLGYHTHKLWKILGYKYFTEDKDMVVVNKEFFKEYAYA